MTDPIADAWLDRIKQTIAVDIGRFQAAGLPPKAIVEKLMEIPEFAQALQMRADRRKASLWLPIDSAPKDGTLVALAEGSFLATGLWRDVYQAWMTPTDDGWQRHVKEPTHWAPLNDVLPPRGIVEGGELEAKPE